MARIVADEIHKLRPGHATNPSVVIAALTNLIVGLKPGESLTNWDRRCWIQVHGVRTASTLLISTQRHHVVCRVHG